MGRLTQSTAEIQEILNGYNALKEQVEKLAGASIDETLMKYLANPYKIMAGTPIPEDLHNLIYDGAYGLNAVIMSVCRYYEMADSTTYAINAVEDNGIYVAGGGYYSYNYMDRVFE